jgi:hypothetical protein
MFVICSLIVTDMLRGSHPHAPFNVSDGWSDLGLLLIVAGTAIRSWAAGSLKKNSELSTSGPYSLSRNPLYLGTFLMMAGFCTLAGTVYDFLVIALLAVLLYLPKIKSEELYLRQKFGPLWLEYCRSTPRLLPRLVNVRQMKSAWSFNRWRINRENVTMSGVIVGLIIFQIWSSRHFPTFAPAVLIAGRSN